MSELLLSGGRPWRFAGPADVLVRGSVIAGIEPSIDASTRRCYFGRGGGAYCLHASWPVRRDGSSRSSFGGLKLPSMSGSGKFGEPW